MTPTADDRGGSLAGTRREAGFLFEVAIVRRCWQQDGQGPIELDPVASTGRNDRHEMNTKGGC